MGTDDAASGGPDGTTGPEAQPGNAPPAEGPAPGGMSRRGFLVAGATAAAAAATFGPSGIAAAVGPPPGRGGGPGGGGPGGGGSGDEDLVLINGRIHTMDDRDRVVSSVSIRGGRFAAVGDGARARGPNTRVINLRGATVVPGIIDNHNHIAAMGLRPGYHTPLENAYSIAEVQDTLIARRADVPAGEFITTIGGFHFNQFAEARLPNLDELDAAVPDRPVYLQVSFSGPSTTNTAGRQWLEARGVEVGADGSIASGVPTGTALLALREQQSWEDKLRTTRDTMAYAASLGVTTHLDEGVFPATGTSADGAAHGDPYTLHDAFLTLHQQGELIVRLRINFLNLETDPDVPALDARLKNSFPFFGDDMIRTGGIGEFTAGDWTELLFGPGPSEAWKNGTRQVAEAGWRNENHSLTATDFQHIIEHWEVVNDEVPITDLRWVLAHVPQITEDYVDRLKALGGGVSLTGWQYLAGSGTSAGPPFRMIVDNGIPVGMSSDGMQIAPMNPWLHMYYATTGRNALGDVINVGQQISREEVLRLYTAANDWFLREDDAIGTIEPDRLADLVVLDRDYFSIPDEELKQIRSAMTVVDGKVVHDDGTIA